VFCEIYVMNVYCVVRLHHELMWIPSYLYDFIGISWKLFGFLGFPSDVLEMLDLLWGLLDLLWNPFRFNLFEEKYALYSSHPWGETDKHDATASYGVYTLCYQAWLTQSLCLLDHVYALLACSGIYIYIIPPRVGSGTLWGMGCQLDLSQNGYGYFRFVWWLFPCWHCRPMHRPLTTCRTLLSWQPLSWLYVYIYIYISVLWGRASPEVHERLRPSSSRYGVRFILLDKR